jgi:hypothetical protein
MTVLEQPTLAEVPAVVHLDMDALQAGMDPIRQSPKNNGTLDMIVIRPAEDERISLTECEMSPEKGLHGDNWASRNPDVNTQITLMNSRAISLLAQSKDRWALAGDQFYVDFDLSDDNLKAGDRFKIGSVLFEVTPKPHTGCLKFAARYGHTAHKFVNMGEGKHLHLRGIYVKVVEAGTVHVGDVIVKC